VSNEGHLVQGQRVTMPVEIRAATAAVAMYSAPAAVAQSIVDYSGLRVLQYRPGKTICSVLFVNYVDGDLGKYHEYGVGFLVRHPGSPARTGDLRSLLRGRAVVFIHRLPVDQAFTLEAGRSIWGFPKVMSEIDLADTGRRAALRIDGQARRRSRCDARSAGAGCLDLAGRVHAHGRRAAPRALEDGGVGYPDPSGWCSPRAG